MDSDVEEVDMCGYLPVQQNKGEGDAGSSDGDGGANPGAQAAEEDDEPKTFAEFSKYREAFKNNIHLAAHLYKDRPGCLISTNMLL